VGRGHGRALLDHLDRLEPQRTSIVSTGTANTPAVNLYKSRGYNETGRIEVAPGVQVIQFQRRRGR
jgi:ribosomal protein S18 acetylase RimI-like enzyme